MYMYMCIHIIYFSYVLCSFTSTSFLFTELEDFMICVTGRISTKKESILVSFDDDINGMIAIHTCTKEISLPYGIFAEADYELFKCSMDAIIKTNDRLKYNSC